MLDRDGDCLGVGDVSGVLEPVNGGPGARTPCEGRFDQPPVDLAVLRVPVAAAVFGVG